MAADVPSSYVDQRRETHLTFIGQLSPASESIQDKIATETESPMVAFDRLTGHFSNKASTLFNLAPSMGDSLRFFPGT